MLQTIGIKGILPLRTGWSKTLTSPASRIGESDTKPICIWGAMSILRSSTFD
jgi:hypothetical protein